MARLLRIPRSPFLYLEYRTTTGIRRESTKQRADNREGRRNANRMLLKKQGDERMLAYTPGHSAFAKWVEPWLRQHCANSPPTLKAYLGRWNTLSMFFAENRIEYPSQLTYAHCQEYLQWRTHRPDKIKSVSQNTARDDLGTLRLIMNEALRRDYCLANPCAKLRIKTGPRRERQEISDADVQRIRNELDNGMQDTKRPAPWPQWMRVQFEIAYHTGRRISETKIAMRTLDLENCMYTVRIKGGKIKTKPFHPNLLPLFRSIQGEFTHTVGPAHSSRMWRDLFAKLNMPYNFHCLRVSFISRLRRSGVDRWTALQIVDHASASIHEHYNRYDEVDLRSALAKVFPVLSQGTPAPPAPSSCASPLESSPRAPERRDHSG